MWQDNKIKCGDYMRGFILGKDFLYSLGDVIDFFEYYMCF